MPGAEILWTNSVVVSINRVDLKSCARERVCHFPARTGKDRGLWGNTGKQQQQHFHEAELYFHYQEELPFSKAAVHTGDFLRWYKLG